LGQTQQSELASPRCTFVQFDLSHGATPIVLLIYAAAAFYFAALFLIGFIAEVRAIPQS